MDKLAQSGKSVAYIKTELAAIRFWCDKISNPKFKHLPDNKALNLARRKYGGVHFHGLRHVCTAEWYKGCIELGDSEYHARKKVAKLLGHGRDDVTRIYLASLNA